MELSSPYIPIDLPWPVICATVLCIYIAYLVARSAFFLPSDEAPVHYEVPLPEQAKPGWSGRVLEEPAIKVLRECIFPYRLKLIDFRYQAQASFNAMTLLPDSFWAMSTQQRRMASTGQSPELLKHSKSGPRPRSRRDGRF